MVIDVHGHWTPVEYLQVLERRREYPRAVQDGDDFRVESAERAVYRATPMHRDLAARIPALDAAGVTRQAISLSSPYGMELLTGDEAVQTAGAVNDALLSAIKPFGERFVPLATVPVDDTSKGVNELRRSLAAGHRGMILSSSVVAHLRDDSTLLPYLREVAAVRGWVLLHPGARVNGAGLPSFAYALNVAGFQNELTVALFRLLFGGLLDAAPGLTLVSVNLGGAAPMMAERMRSMWEGRNEAGTPPDDGFRRAYYDYSSFREHSLEAAAAVLGADRIVLGTDFPIQGLERPLRVLKSARLDDAAREAISHGNAASFL